MEQKRSELDKWQEVKDYIGEERVSLGPVASYQLRNTPRRILFSLSHYKFAAKLLGEGKDVLEVGCGEGLGTCLLAEFANKVIGIDIDVDAISEAKRIFASERTDFLTVDILKADLDNRFDGIVCFDVIEHIYLENEGLFFENCIKHLKANSICIIGTPNETSDQYASEVSRLGHVNLYSWKRLEGVMLRYFEQVFIFSANDEMIHTGFYPMAHYLIAVGIGIKHF